MKYAWYSMIALVLAFGAGFFLAALVRRKLKKKPPLWAHILSGTGIGILICVAAAFGYLSVHYSAKEEALQVLSESSGVKISPMDGGYRLDGPGEKAALIFYPGTKVEAEAYLPLMKRTAEKGVDCFLLKMPMNMPFFGKNAADRVTAAYDYETLLIGGHSLGGYVAAGYAAEHEDRIDGVVLLAAYPPAQLGDSLRLLSVYGSEDGELGMESYESAKRYYPKDSTEVIIQGGNHAQFGNYGSMKNDGEATITAREQQEQTADAIVQIAQGLLRK